MNEEKQLKYSRIFCVVILIFCLGVIFFCIVLTADTNKIQKQIDEKKENYIEICPICNGKIVCAICGSTDAEYCEKNDYGAGTDHYCEKHYWSEVVPYHNNLNKSKK